MPAGSFAARFDREGNEQRLIDALAELPPRPYEALCHCLENERIGTGLSAALLEIGRAQLRLGAPAAKPLAATLRAISRSRTESLPRQLVREVLDDPVADDAEILAAIGARAWTTLRNPALVNLFLERLANNSLGQTFFDQCLADLLYIPGMREPLLSGLRAPQRSAALSSAVGAFFGSLGSNG